MNGENAMGAYMENNLAFEDKNTVPKADPKVSESSGMIEARLPENEPERLDFLHGMNVLDTPIEERFERITRLVCTTLDVPIAALSLVDGTRQWFKSVQGINASVTPRSIAFCAHAILEDGIVVVNDATKDERFYNNPLVTGTPNIRTYAGCPIYASNKIKVGTLCAIDTKERNFTKEQLNTLKDLTKIAEAELAIDAFSEASQQLLVELNEAKRSAMIDPLTRVWNRAGIEVLLKKEWEMAKRKRSPLSVIFFDIDDFKKINDTHGHCAGDDVIRRLSRIIVSSIRSCDSIGRWGGDEFLAVLPLCQVEDIMRVVNNIDQAVNSAEVDERFNIIRKSLYTMSMGAASLVPDESNSLEMLIRNADRAMYKAKRAGKGKFELDVRS
jgi:diguanylate cyclase (GGDEF)-like protein